MALELRVKKGPGDIIGLNKVSIVDNVADFSNIQFNEPGQYTISVISSLEDVEDTEFDINILPEEEVIPQADSNDIEDPIVGNRPIISQIDQPIIRLEPMEYETGTNKDDDQEIATSIGFTPFFWYNGIQIQDRYVSKLDIYYDDFVPKARVVFLDNMGIVNSPETMPLNDNKFELFLNSGSDVLKSIHLKFKLELSQKNKNGTNTITGVLDLDDFYKVGYKSYKGTSFEALRKLSNDMGLGFNSNITNTNDSMIWRRNGVKTKDFIKDVVEHSYISDDSFMFGYIDYYYSFNYIDVEKEWNRDITNDVGLESQGVSSKAIDDNSKIVRMELTNDPSANSSSFFITNVKFNNNSTYLTNNGGNITISKVYDRVNKQFLKFDVDSLSSDQKNNIILKGNLTNSKEQTENYQTTFRGKMDIDNVHSNYLYAVDQNKRNLLNLSNISIEAELPQPNFNLYKFQKVQINFVNQKESPTNEQSIDERLTGSWIIADIRYIWSRGSLRQSINAVRKELGKTTDEKLNQTIEENKSVNNSEINENEIINDDNVDFSFGDVLEESYLLDDDFKETEFDGLSLADMKLEEESISIGTEVEYESGSTNIDIKNKLTWDKEGTIVYGSKVPIELASEPSGNLNIKLNSTIRQYYIPEINKINASYGVKLLATIMAQKEGFNLNSRSYRTNNPGNIGNTDNGKNREFESLSLGIKMQIDYINKVAAGAHTSYPLGGSISMKPYYSPEIEMNQSNYKITPFLPGYEFSYDGKIEQYVKIYSTGARAGNSYINMIVSWFRQNGHSWVNSETKISQLIAINSDNNIV